MCKRIARTKAKPIKNLVIPCSSVVEQPAVIIKRSFPTKVGLKLVGITVKAKAKHSYANTVGTLPLEGAP